jgi:hypothetical protein
MMKTIILSLLLNISAAPVRFLSVPRFSCCQIFSLLSWWLMYQSALDGALDAAEGERW